MNTKQIGDETEVRVITALIAEGYSVSIPFGDNDKYDLVLDTGNQLLRVQCKTGWIEDAGKKSTYLRLTEPEIDHPSVNRAETYRFETRLP